MKRSVPFSQIFIMTMICFSSSCAMDSNSSSLVLLKAETHLQVFVESSNPVLSEIICHSLQVSQKGKCVDNLLQSNQNLKIEAHIRDSSSDYLLNNSKSFLSLTLGVFISHSAIVDFHYAAGNTTEHLRSGFLTTKARVGHWAVLPFYTGLIATNLGTWLNTYRNPEHLEKYCLREEPGVVRQILEANREDYCADYKLFLQDSYFSIEEKIYSELLESNR